MGNYAVVDNGLVTNIILWNGTNDWSPSSGESAVEVKDGADVQAGYSYADGVFTPPVAPKPSQEELVAAAKEKKTQVLQFINQYTQIWQTQLSLSIISDDDKATLIQWMKYAQAVDSVDVSNPPVDWPVQPEIQ